MAHCQPLHCAVHTSADRSSPTRGTTTAPSAPGMASSSPSSSSAAAAGAGAGAGATMSTDQAFDSLAQCRRRSTAVEARAAAAAPAVLRDTSPQCSCIPAASGATSSMWAPAPSVHDASIRQSCSREASVEVLNNQQASLSTGRCTLGMITSSTTWPGAHLNTFIILRSAAQQVLAIWAAPLPAVRCHGT